MGFVQALGFAHPEGHTAVVFAACSRLKTLRHASGNADPAGCSGQRKNESAPDPGLSLGTPVEQPSPRTAQTQPRFLPGRRKWPRSASRRHHRATNASEQSQNRASGGDNVEEAGEARSLPEGGGLSAAEAPHLPASCMWSLRPGPLANCVIARNSRGERQVKVGLPTLIARDTSPSSTSVY